MIPEVFDGVNVWRLCWPWKEIDSIGFEPVLGPFASVLWVVIFLEDDILLGFSIIFDAGAHVVFQNLDVKLPVHLLLSVACISNTFPHHTAPHYHRTSFQLHYSLHQPITQTLPWEFPHNPPAI